MIKPITDKFNPWAVKPIGQLPAIRKPSNPDAEQARIYTALGIDPKTAYTPVRDKAAMERFIVPLES